MPCDPISFIWDPHLLGRELSPHTWFSLPGVNEGTRVSLKSSDTANMMISDESTLYISGQRPCRIHVVLHLYPGEREFQEWNALAVNYMASNLKLLIDPSSTIEFQASDEIPISRRREISGSESVSIPVSPNFSAPSRPPMCWLELQIQTLGPFDFILSGLKFTPPETTLEYPSCSNLNLEDEFFLRESPLSLRAR